MARIKPTMSTTVPVELLHKIELEAEAHHCSRSLVVEKGMWLYFDVVQPEYDNKSNRIRRRIFVE